MDALIIALVLVSAVLAGVELVRSRFQSLLAWGLMSLTLAAWFAWGASLD